MDTVVVSDKGFVFTERSASAFKAIYDAAQAKGWAVILSVTLNADGSVEGGLAFDPSPHKSGASDALDTCAFVWYYAPESEAVVRRKIIDISDEAGITFL